MGQLRSLGAVLASATLALGTVAGFGPSATAGG